MIEPWSVTIGAMFGAIGTFVIMTVWMAPKHWEQWQALKAERARNTQLVDDVAHYRALVGPRQWGSVEQAKAEQDVREVKVVPWEGIVTPPSQHAYPSILIDDIRDHVEWLEPPHKPEDAPYGTET